LIGGTEGTKSDVAVARSLEGGGYLIPIPGTGVAADAAAEQILKEQEEEAEVRTVVAELKKARFAIDRKRDTDVNAIIAALERHFKRTHGHLRERKPTHS
jgi:hypothetical protein